MAGKNRESIFENREIIEQYFEPELKALMEELDKSKEYSKTIDDEIKKLSFPSLGSNKGSQHYLIEHITNAVQLQTQRQGIWRDVVSIKAKILDYSIKLADEDRETGKDGEYLKALSELIEMRKSDNKKEEKVEQDESELDSQIDKALEK